MTLTTGTGIPTNLARRMEYVALNIVLPRGVPRVDDRCVLDGIFCVLHSGAPWSDLPEAHGPHMTRYNGFVRWRKAGVWDRLMQAVTAAHDADVQMIDSSSVRVHQHAANTRESGGDRCLGRIPGGSAPPQDRDGWRGAEYSVQYCPPLARLVRRRALPRTKPHRAALQLDQALPPYRYALREARLQLARHAQARCRPPLAQA